jgi:hypothetical protein
LSGYWQPTEIRAPQGARIAPVVDGGFAAPQPDRLLVGLAVGPVYRFRVTEIPGYPGLEAFPTVEVIDRLYPPEGQALKFPVPVDLAQEELLLAAEGKFVTRVIYLEDPQLAIPIAEQSPSPTRWIDVRAGGDPLVTADSLGRPVAILRIGGRVPEPGGMDATFLCGSPPLLVYDQALQHAAEHAQRGRVTLAPHLAPIESLP